MIHKKLLAPERLRQIPSQFSWLDQRLVRGGHLHACDSSAWALYLFLAIVADAQGLSYYSDAAVIRMLKLDPLVLSAARQQLVSARLLAYQKPLYQLLALPAPSPEIATARVNQVHSIGALLRQMAGGAA